MDLTTGLQQIQDKYKAIKRYSEQYLTNEDILDNIIDVNKVNFDNDETWLYSTNKEGVPDVMKWLYDTNIDVHQFSSSPIQVTKSDSQKNIDTRTFTRPKRRFNRPSIEKYNQELYSTGDSIDSSTDISKKSVDSGFVIDVNESTSTKPLYFDLAQPTSSYYFENVLAKTTEADSFQNMSPPSLVNSMCSSTFANLMENSFIKNDPVLREIRDKDYTDSILLQECEPPMFQSFTESFSSVNSDSPESFLKKVAFNGTKNVSNDLDCKPVEKNNATFDLNSTYDKTIVNTTGDKTHDDNCDSCDSLDDKSTIYAENYGATYRRPPKHSHTFRKSDLKSDTLNATFHMSPNGVILDGKESSPRNTTLTINSPMVCGDTTITKEDSEILKNQLNGSLRHTNDLNKQGYCMNRQDLNDSFLDDKNDVHLKRNSIGSADSLDRMSSLSNSSRGSNKMLNMADVDAIVEMQEKSLRVMSTPKPHIGMKKMWDHNFISPIVPNNQYSDSDDLSSNEDYKSVKSSASKISLDNQRLKSTKNLNFTKTKVDAKSKKVLPRSVFTTKNVQDMPPNLRGSYSNLKSAGNLGSSQSNLKTMGPKLKGSYTSLRPISAYLPVAPPLLSQTGLNTTTTLLKASNPNVTQVIEAQQTNIAEVHPIPRLHSTEASLKPRMSGLPRPLAASGLPRPVSRIPGPKSNIRPVSRPASSMDRH